MQIIKALSVSSALAAGISYLTTHACRDESRNGTVLVSSVPVTTVYANPTHRVLFGPLRDANPFFHLMESLWMLAGDNDLEFPQRFNKRFGEYSDDGRTVHGAYGFRWREHFGYDQLGVIIKELIKNPTSRRCVLAMWDAQLGFIGEDEPAGDDLNIAMHGGKDVPCNTHIYFRVNDWRLDMTVCCRSNDIIWGAYGANAVHMSMLMEYVAAALDVPLGVYYQMSNNYHAYTDVYGVEKLKAIAREAEVMDFYCAAHAAMHSTPVVTPFKLVNSTVDAWNQDLRMFMLNPEASNPYKDVFFSDVARPMYLAWQERKQKVSNGSQWVERVQATDWKLAAQQWIARREAA